MTGEPLINSTGVKWWTDESLTEWCRRADLNGVSLPDYKVWIVETPEGKRTRLLCEGETILSESPRTEDIAVKIDILKAIQHYDRRTD